MTNYKIKLYISRSTKYKALILYVNEDDLCKRVKRTFSEFAFLSIYISADILTDKDKIACCNQRVTFKLDTFKIVLSNSLDWTDNYDDFKNMVEPSINRYLQQLLCIQRDLANYYLQEYDCLIRNSIDNWICYND